MCLSLINTIKILHSKKLFQGLLNSTRVVVCGKKRFKFIDRMITKSAY